MLPEFKVLFTFQTEKLWHEIYNNKLECIYNIVFNHKHIRHHT